MRPLRVEDLGLIAYPEAHRLQRARVDARTAGHIGDSLLLLEHPHVFTRGRKARDLGNVLAPGDVPVIDVERGGDVTYHGPGQLVAYPIVQLPEGERDAPAFIRRLERWLVTALAGVGLPDAAPRPGYAGVWCRGQKVASVGVAVTAAWVTWHGVAINVCPNLAYFDRINPCGLESRVMASLESLTGAPATVANMKRALLAALPHLGYEATPPALP